MALSLFNRLLDFAFATFSNRVLGPAEVGNYAYAVVIFGWFDTITNYGLNLLLTREVAADKARANRWLLNTTALRLWLGLSIIPFFAGGLLAINSSPAVCSRSTRWPEPSSPSRWRSSRSTTTPCWPSRFSCLRKRQGR